ncbi:BOC [Mytilus coruscus]|uniref:BOC n=1 Tax=Mytilus coruscus TaxID=42192 RepID=A0A6J8DZP7_MYTCO|nr:BOC [Mytilus coruscus]
MGMKSGVLIADGNTTNPKQSIEKKFAVSSKSGFAYLHIENLTASDEGTYKCLSYDSSTNITTQYNFRLYLKELIIVNSIFNNTINCTENEAITLSCFSTGGVSNGNVSWINRKGMSWSTDDDDVWSNITFTPTRHNNGQIYTCLLSHGLQLLPLNKSVTLNVFYYITVTTAKVPSSIGVAGIPSIAIYLLTCGCAVIITITIAEIWSCRRSGRSYCYRYLIVTVIVFDRML